MNLTWQADAKNKFNFFWHLTRRNLLYDSYVTQTPEAAQYLYSTPDYIAQVSWTNPVTSKFLLEAGGTIANETWWSIQRGYGDNQPVNYGIDAGQDILNVTNGPASSITKYELSNATLYGASIYQHEGVLAPVQRPVRGQLRDRQPCVQGRHAGHVRHAPVHLWHEQLAVLALQSAARRC